MAKIFKKRGYKTSLVKLLKREGEEELDKSAFDNTISFELEYFQLKFKNIFPLFFYFLKQLKHLLNATFSFLKLKPDVIIARSHPNLPVAILRIFVRKPVFIYFPYDIEAQLADSASRMKEVYGKSILEIKAEKFCFEKSDGIIHKGRPDELEHIKGRTLGEDIKYPRYILNFFPYASKEFMVPINKEKLSKKDKEIHLVYVGAVGSVGFMELDDVALFIEEKIHVHFYLRPNSTSNEKVIKTFKEDSEFTRRYEKILKSKYFHLHKPIHPKKLALEISKYDFGLWIGPAEKKEYNIEPSMAMGNKFASYIEAGIPFISTEINEFIIETGKKYGIVLSYSNNKESIKKLKKEIKSLNKEKVLEGIKRARRDFLMEKHFPRLEKFIKEVIESKKARLL